MPFNPQFGINWAEVLPNDHVLITTMANSKITEYDGGRQAGLGGDHSGRAAGPTRLANGHTLVPTVNNTKVAELDPRRQGRRGDERPDVSADPRDAALVGGSGMGIGNRKAQSRFLILILDFDPAIPEP